MPSLQDFTTRVIDNVEQVIIGKREAIELLMAALLCEGHVLIEDVPGVGKTMLARSIAISLGGQFKRLQCTPDLLPNDVTGVSVFNQQSGEFEFRPGPIFVNVLLADEINRATPRTQSALLEAMQEQQVTVDGVSRMLPRPFMVLATQNPIEYEGTFPLPEAQLDRFLLRVAIGYPETEEEREVLRRFREADPLEALKPVVAGDEVLALSKACRQVYISPAIETYILSVVRATRDNPALALGASPRGSLALARTAQVLAAVRGRAFVIPDDVQLLIVPTLAHRLILSSQSRLRGKGVPDVLQSVIEQVPVPVEETWSDPTA
jgi:MoxR-like ATPase